MHFTKGYCLVRLINFIALYYKFQLTFDRRFSDHMNVFITYRTRLYSPALLLVCMFRIQRPSSQTGNA